MSLLSDYHGIATRSRAIGIHQTSVYIGTIAGGTFAALIGQHYGWRWSFLVFGGAGVLLGLVLRDSFANRYGEWPIGANSTPPHRTSDGQCGFQTSCAHLVGPYGRPVDGSFRWSELRRGRSAQLDAEFLFDRFQMSLAVAGLTATLFAQLASMVGSLSGGWIADSSVRELRAAASWFRRSASLRCTVRGAMRVDALRPGVGARADRLGLVERHVRCE